MIKPNANIIIHFEKPYYYVGEFIKGAIEIYTKISAIINDIIIDIFLSEDWKIKEGCLGDFLKKRIVSYKLDLIKLKIFRIIDNEKIILPVGISLVPFSFRFSEDNYPCFEFPRPHKRAYIRYSFFVTLNSMNISGSATTSLCLLSRPFIEAEKKLSISIKQSIKKWKIVGEGDTILKVSIPENNYKYDSECKLDIEIDNINGKMSTKEFKVTLIREVIFKNNYGVIKHTEVSKIVRDIVKAEVKRGQKNKFEYNLKFKENNVKKLYNYKKEYNPYNIDIEKINFFMPTVKGKLITCEYHIKISLYFSHFVGKAYRPRVKIPIYIVHQLPVDYQLEIQEQIELENALKESKADENKNRIKSFNSSHNNDINNKNDNEYNHIDNKSQNILNDYNNEVCRYSQIDLPEKEEIEKFHNNQQISENENNNENNIENNAPCHPYPSIEDISAPAPFSINQNINNTNNININNNHENENININEYDAEITNTTNNVEFSIFSSDTQKNEPQNNYEDINAI